VHSAGLSIWNNKWQSIFDFTKNPSGELNYKIKKSIERNFVVSLKNMKAFTNAYMNDKGIQKIESISDVLSEVQQ